MTADDSQYTAMLVLWTVLLGVVLFILLPMTVYRAGRLVAAARSIDTNLAVTLAAAAAVVGNTRPTTALLDETIDAAGQVLATAGQIDAHTAAIERVLVARAAVARS